MLEFVLEYLFSSSPKDQLKLSNDEYNPIETPYVHVLFLLIIQHCRDENFLESIEKLKKLLVQHYVWPDGWTWDETENIRQEMEFIMNIYKKKEDIHFIIARWIEIFWNAGYEILGLLLQTLRSTQKFFSYEDISKAIHLAELKMNLIDSPLKGNWDYLLSLEERKK